MEVGATGQTITKKELKKGKRERRSSPPIPTQKKKKTQPAVLWLKREGHLHTFR